MRSDERDGGDATTLRLDKWLWAARFFKTRSIASEAVDGGKVHLNGERVKRARAVRVGDEVQIRIGQYEYRVTVLSLSDRRGPASVAAALYEELPESRAARETLAARQRMESAGMPHDTGKPNKRDRRQLDEFRRRG